jgi:hypothetical protein
MKLILLLLPLIMLTSYADTIQNPLDQPQGIVSYAQVQPVIINNCAACHNASTPSMNWLDKNTFDGKSELVYDRVFVRGDMPFWFKYFGGQEKDLLKRYLQQRIITIESLREGLKKARELNESR